MNEPEQFDQLDELMAGYVLGNLSSEEAEELQQLLEAHPDRARDILPLLETLEMLPYALPTVTPPQYLEDSIFRSTQVKVARKPIRLPSWKIAIATALATLTAGSLIWNNLTLRQNLRVAEAEIARQKDVVAMLQNPETHLVSLKGMDMASKASGRIIMTPGEPQSVLIVQKLPTLPQGKYYQLWSIVDGKKVPSGQFNASDNGSVLVKLPTPSALEVTGLLITVEESSHPEKVPGLMVMTSNL